MPTEMQTAARVAHPSSSGGWTAYCEVARTLSDSHEDTVHPEHEPPCAEGSRIDADRACR